MNLLQQFMAECNRQTRPINQEEVVINGSPFFGTFGDPQLQPVAGRFGSEDQIVYPFLSSADQYATPPQAKQKLIRSANNVEYFIEAIDSKDPVTYTFILLDRQP